MPDEPKDAETSRGFLWNVHLYINEYIRFADMKAELVIVWDTAVIGGLLAVKFPTLFDYKTALGIGAMVAFGLMVLSFMVATYVVIPRLPRAPGRGYVFWGNILEHKTRDEFVASFKNAPQTVVDDEVTAHLFDLSKVSDKKYYWVWWCIVLASVGSLACGGLYIENALRNPVAP